MYLTPVQRELAWLRMWGMSEVPELSVPLLWRLRRMLKDEKLVSMKGKVVINSFMPPFPSAAFGRMMRSLNEVRHGRVAPISAYVSVTDRCRSRCWHCSRSYRKGPDMDAETLHRAVKELLGMGVSIIGFTGGEPLQRKELDELIAGVGNAATTILFSSGDGLTAKRAMELKRRGLFAAAISLDHYDEGEHDRRRGRRGAFRAATQAVRNAREAGLFTIIQWVATRDMLKEEEWNRHLGLAKDLGVHEIRLLEPMPTGCLVGGDKSWMLTAEERKSLRELHIRAAHARDLPKVTAFAHIEDAGMYGCGAGFQHVYIDAKGNVCPCDFTPVSFGNVREEPLADVWGRMREAFARPRRTCFLMANAERLAEAFRGELPLRYEDVRTKCDFGGEGALPGFYRLLGWEDEPATEAGHGCASCHAHAAVSGG